jgi:hypothetical protein
MSNVCIRAQHGRWGGDPDGNYWVLVPRYSSGTAIRGARRDWHRRDVVQPRPYMLVAGNQFLNSFHRLPDLIHALLRRDYRRAISKASSHREVFKFVEAVKMRTCSIVLGIIFWTEEKTRLRPGTGGSSFSGT